MLGNGNRSNVQSQPQINYKDPVPKAKEPNLLKPRQEVNYVRENHDRIINEKTKSVNRIPVVMGKPQPQHKNHGKVPQYIDKYKQQREEAIKQLAIQEENAKLPQGTRLMPEQERIDTLTDLIAAKRVTNDKLEKLPIQIKSLKVAAHKRELEDKLTRLERAIETFSRPKVFVKF